MVGRILRRLDRENGHDETCKTLDGDLLPFTDLESNYDKLNKVQLTKVGPLKISLFRNNKKMLEFSFINFKPSAAAHFQSV